MLKDNATIFFLPKPWSGLRSVEKFSGKYRFEVRDARTGEIRRETDWMENLITDYGLNLIGTANWFSECRIGTGTNTPANSDTALQTNSATTTNKTTYNWVSSGSPLYDNTATMVFRFASGALNGNYSEVGVGVAGGLFSRALIVDGGGSPTTITVGATEYLDVHYAVTRNPDLTTHTDSVVISGVTYSVQRKPSMVGDINYGRTGVQAKWCQSSVAGANSIAALFYTSGMGAVTGQPTGGTSSNNGQDGSTGTYSAGSHELSGSFFTDMANGNLSGGIKTMVVLGAMATYQYEFDTTVPKDATKTLNITGKTVWARV